MRTSHVLNAHFTARPDKASSTCEAPTHVPLLSLSQGPKKTFPAVPFARFMDAKSKGFATLHERQHDLEEHANGLNFALGIPEVTAAA